MFFGKKLREMRLEANMGLRKFADKIKMSPSEYSNMEHGYIAPPSAWDGDPEEETFMYKLHMALGLGMEDGGWEEMRELRGLYYAPFVMQKMSECGIILHATRRIQSGEEGFTSEEDDCNTRPSTGKECSELSEYINNIAKEHNKKADAYNKDNK